MDESRNLAEEMVFCSINENFFLGDSISKQGCGDALYQFPCVSELQAHHFV